MLYRSIHWYTKATLKYHMICNILISISRHTRAHINHYSLLELLLASYFRNHPSSPAAPFLLTVSQCLLDWCILTVAACRSAQLDRALWVGAKAAIVVGKACHPHSSLVYSLINNHHILQNKNRNNMK